MSSYETPLPTRTGPPPTPGAPMRPPPPVRRQPAAMGMQEMKEAVEAAYAAEDAAAKTKAEPKTEPAAPDPSEKRELDLVFTMDVTGSMGTYIQSAKRNVERIAARLQQENGYDVRFGLVVYRDHHQGDEFVQRRFQFTRDAVEVKNTLATISATGGGDGPEAVEAGLLYTLHMDWRETATKICVLIGDAPPHGLGEAGDTLPNGAPTGVDPFKVLNQMSQKGITIYAVGCEPALSAYVSATNFWISAAQKTNGRAVALESAASLGDIIVGGAVEEMDLHMLQADLCKRVREVRLSQPHLPEAEVQNQVYRALSSSAGATRQLSMKGLESEDAHLLAAADALETARAALAPIVKSHTMRPKAEPRGYYRGLAATDGPEGCHAAYRSLAAADDGIKIPRLYRAMSAAAPSPMDVAPPSAEEPAESTEVKIEEGTLTMEQFARLYKKLEKTGVL